MSHTLTNKEQEYIDNFLNENSFMLVAITQKNVKNFLLKRY
jgi:hypothetical protein